MSICPRCQAVFTCAMADNTGKDCWCTAIPPIAFEKLPDGKLEMDARCFCPTCLPEWKAEREALQNPISAIQLP